MRTDNRAGFNRDFRHLDGILPLGRLVKDGASLSGYERDSVYYSLGGTQFANISGISGLDHPGDGRSFAILDYDRDGWTDFVVVSANAPTVQLYRNQIGEGSEQARKHHMVAVRFVGGNHTAQPTAAWSNRDGYGALVTLTLDGLTLRREHRAGEGFAAQNSPTVLIGIGARDHVNALTVRWPSGKVQEVASIPANSLVTIYEDPTQSPTRSAFVIEPYQEKRSARTLPHATARSVDSAPRLQVAQVPVKGPRPQLVLYTTMATWCAACLTELPQFNMLRATFQPHELGMFGVPYDEKEGAGKLSAWATANRPPYTLLTEAPNDYKATVKQTAIDILKLDGIPASIVTDGEGRVLLAKWGPPSVSEVRELLMRTRNGKRG